MVALAVCIGRPSVGFVTVNNHFIPVAAVAFADWNAPKTILMLVSLSTLMGKSRVPFAGGRLGRGDDPGLRASRGRVQSACR